MNRYRLTNRNHHDVRFEKGLRICYVSPPELVPLSECFAGKLFLDRVDPNDTFAHLRSPPLPFLGGMRRSPRVPIDKSFERRYTCVHCNERFTSVFADVPSDAFALYDVKGKKLCRQGCWEKMMMRVFEHLASLSTPKARRSTHASSASSGATLPEPVDTPQRFPVVPVRLRRMLSRIVMGVANTLHNEPLMRGHTTSPRQTQFVGITWVCLCFQMRCACVGVANKTC